MSEAKPLWKDKSHEPASRVALAPCGVVFVERNHKLTCLSLTDGSERWSVATALLRKESIALSIDPRGETIVVAEHGDAEAHRASDGAQLWAKVMRENFIDEPQPMWSADSIFLSATLSPVVALDRASGEKRWSQAGDPSELGANALAVVGTTVVAHTYSTVAAYDAASGAERWHFAFSQKHGPSVPRLAASLEASAQPEGLIVTLDPQAVIALDAATGKVLWKRTTQGLASFAISGSMLLVADGAQVRGLDARTGAEKWHVVANGPTWAAPLTAERAFVHLPRQLATIDYATGKVHDGGAHTLGEDDAVLTARGGVVVMAFDHGAAILREKGGKLVREDVRELGEPIAARVDGATVVVQGKDGSIALFR